MKGHPLGRKERSKEEERGKPRERPERERPKREVVCVCVCPIIGEDSLTFTVKARLQVLPKKYNLAL
jgi:hypothetical protein